MPSTPETLLPSYQTTPRTPRTLPVRPAPPFTLAACVLCAPGCGVCGWQQVSGQGRTEDVFNGAEARQQSVGRVDGAAAATFSHCRAL